MQALVDETLWATLESSQLLSAEQLSAVRKLVSTAEAPVASNVLLRQLVKKKWLTLFQAERLLHGQTRGFFFDQYKVLDLLGVGGMGWIYQAVDTTTGEIVALKAMRQDFRHDQGLLARLQQEARVGMKLNHPHILRTYYLGSAGGLPYLTMEYVAGPNLQELICEYGHLPWDQACELARQTALALAYAHSRGIIHRDIKPQNLLIDPTGNVRLLDFGLSMIQEGEAGDEFSFAMIFGHESVGTLEFAAPEQFKDSLAADARSDLYSLGATFYATLTGYQPCPSTDRPQKRLPALTELVPEIPVEVSNIVMKLLEVDPDKRFASAEEVSTAFAQWANARPLDTDFSTILAKRKKSMEQRLAKSPGSRSATAIAARSTARPGNVSSVAMAVPLRRSNAAMDVPEFPEPEVASPPALSDLIGGPALEWSQESPRMGQAGLVLKPANLPGQIPLQQDYILVGRSADCDVQIIDSTVSSKHCEFRFDGRRWWITDLKSLNGTRVNGREVKRQRALRPGDDIRIGNGPRFRAHWPGVENRDARGRFRFVLWGLLFLAAVIGVTAVLLSQGAIRR